MTEPEATDIERTIDMISHIKQPCLYKKGTDEYSALRKSYIAMAKKMVLPTLENPYAKKLLEDVIKEYQS